MFPFLSIPSRSNTPDFVETEGLNLIPPSLSFKLKLRLKTQREDWEITFDVQVGHIGFAS